MKGKGFRRRPLGYGVTRKAEGRRIKVSSERFHTQRAGFWERLRVPWFRWFESAVATAFCRRSPNRHKSYPAAVVTNLVMAKAVREGLHFGTENFFDFAQVVAWWANE